MNSLMQEKTIKAIIAVLTLLVALATFILGIVSFRFELFGLGFVSFMLTAFLVISYTQIIYISLKNNLND